MSDGTRWWVVGWAGNRRILVYVGSSQQKGVKVDN